MGQIVRATHTGYSATNTSQVLNINEGDLSTIIAPIVLTTGLNYGDYLFATFPISGTSQAAAISLVCSTLNGLSLTRTGDTYVLSSLYIKNGVKVNNWQYFKIALQSLSLAFSNSDISQNFTLPWALYYGQSETWSSNTLGLTGNIAVNVAAVPDATGLFQTINTLQAFGGGGTPNTMAGYSGANIQINDPNQAAKTYRVTYTVNDVTNGTGTSDLKMSLVDTPTSTNYVWVKTFTLTGTQTQINDIMTNSGGEGWFIFQRNPRFYGTQTISYVQEVLTSTEPGAVVPYVQETGTITINQAYVPSFTTATGVTYVEDVSTTPFSIGTVTDQSGQSWPTDTGVNGLNYYNFLIEATGSYPGTNPIALSCTGFGGTPGPSFSVQGTYAYYQDSLSPNNNFIVIPPADWTDPIPLRIRLYRGYGTGMSVISDTTLTVNCSSTHNEFSILSGFGFALGANVINFGSITDTATGKSYTITIDLKDHPSSTHGSLSTTSYGSWNATGGAYGNGRLTLTGTKSQLNSVLSAVTYTTAGGQTLNDTVIFEYTQTQTTNTIAQGAKNISVANDIVWSSPSFTYDQDVSSTWNVATLGGNIGTGSYTAKIVFSTPLSTANLGGVTGWTRETDYIWTKTDTRANLNTALSAVVFNPPAQLVTSFTMDVKVYDGVTLVADTSAIGATRTVTVGTLVSAAWTGSALTYNQDTAATFTNLLTLNSNFNSGTYTLRLKTSVATGGTITGWTTIDSTTFEKVDTKANLQSALNSLVFTPSLTFVSNFTLNVEAYRSGLKIYDSSTVPNSKTVSIGTVYSITPTASVLNYNQDNVATWASVASVSSNFDAAKTYTITITSSVASIGSMAGWTTATTTTFTKTDTGANLLTALSSIAFTPAIALKTNFTLTFSITRSSTVVATSSAKTIFINVVYNITVGSGGSSFTFDQDAAKTWTNMFSFSSNYVAANTYTFELRTKQGGVLANVGSFTGWTNISTGVYRRTANGTDIKTYANSLEFNGTLANFSAFNLELDTLSGSTLVTSGKPWVSLTIQPGSVYGVSTGSKSYTYGITTLFTNFATMNARFNDSETYTVTVSINGADGSISGSGFTGSGSSITVTGNKTTCQAAFTSGITFDPVSYLTTNTSFTISVVKSSTTIISVSNNFAVTGVPTIAVGSSYYYYFIGSGVNHSPLVNVTNIPNDGSEYRVKIEITSNQVLGTVTSPGLTWSVTGGTTATSAYATKATLETALANVSINASITSTLQDTFSPPQVRFTLQGNSGTFADKVTSYVNLWNAADINKNYPLTIVKGTTANLNLGTTTANPTFTRLYPANGTNVMFYNSGATYTLKIDTLGTSVSLGSPWIHEGGNIYSVSGTPATLTTYLTAVPFTASATAISRDLFMKVYQSSTYLANINYRLTTT